MKLATIVTLATVIALPATAQCTEGEVIIRFAHDAPAAGHPKGEAAALLADLVNSDLDGRACMIVEAEADYYSDDTLLEGFANGDYQIAAPSMGNLGEISPRFLVFDLPFLFRDLSVVLAYQDSPLALDLLKEAESEGLLGLAYWIDGVKAMSADTEIRVPADISGLAFGTQNGLVEVDYFNELGAQSEFVAPNQLSSALATGRVNGQNNTWPDIAARQLYLNQSGITQTNHGLVQYMLTTDPAFWESLDPDLRSELELLIAIASQERSRFAFELANLAQNAIRRDDGAIVTLTDEERLTWVRAMQPTWFRFGGAVGFDQIAAALSAARDAPDMFKR